MTSTTEVAPPEATHILHLGVAAGIGIASRAFRPGPSTVLAYESAPVPTLALDAHVRPTKRISLTLGIERTLQLSTPMRDGSSAPTTFSRWESTATYALLLRDSFEIGARAGAGHRAFAIESADTGRSPDSDYNYLIAGIGATVRAGQRVAFHANAALEPVLFGDEPTEMAFGVGHGGHSMSVRASRSARRSMSSCASQRSTSASRGRGTWQATAAQAARPTNIPGCDLASCRSITRSRHEVTVPSRLPSRPLRPRR